MTIQTTKNSLKLLQADSLNNNGTRTAVSTNQFRNYGVQLLWRKTFPAKGKELTADVTSNWNKSKNGSNWTDYKYKKDGTAYTNSPFRQITDGNNKGNQIVFQLDYINPLNDSTKWEMGVRSNYKVNDQTFLAASNSTG